MADYKLQYFAWCNVEGHDKVWGYVTVGQDNKLYNFWGRRGKRYTFKIYPKPESRWDRNTLRELAREKETPGRKSGTYVPVDPSKVEEVVPGFENEFLHQLTLAKLFDNFHGLIEKGAPR